MIHLAHRRLFLFLTVLVVTCGLTVILDFSQLVWPSYFSYRSQSRDAALTTQQVDRLDPSNFVKGTPTESLFDNLRPDVQYLTSWSSTGFTNDVMSYVNQIYLAILTDRVAVIPPFWPGDHHQNRDSLGMMPFSEVFDLPRLRREIQHPVIEWKDLKQDNGTLDWLGCWSTMLTIKGWGPNESPLYERTGVDIAFTAVPNYTKLDIDSHVKIMSLARLSFQDDRQDALGQDLRTLPARGRGEYTKPEEQFMCFDFLFFTGVDEKWEWYKQHSPPWRFVGKHLHFTKQLEDMAERHLRGMFGVTIGEPIPPFIVIHVRHGDFLRWACDGRTPVACMKPLSSWAEDVKGLQERLSSEKGLDVQRVILTSDDKDPTFWQDAKRYGWYAVDHERINAEEHLDEWYHVFVDIAITSMAKGFVGTASSSFSMIGGRRVEDWNDGISVMVPWKLPMSE